MIVANSGLTQATASLELRETQLSVLTGAVNNIGSATLGTVGAGKTWYIVGLNLTISGNAVGSGTAKIQNDGSTIASCAGWCLNGAVTSNSVCQSFGVDTYIKVNATKAVTLTLDANNLGCTAEVYYYEE